MHCAIRCLRYGQRFAGSGKNPAGSGLWLTPLPIYHLSKFVELEIDFDAWDETTKTQNISTKHRAVSKIELGLGLSYGRSLK